jgi:GT2 family glycosyltransferase
MVFSTAALRTLGGFDEALDTGPPLPTGGDIDMFYRVLRAGHRLVHLPGLVVHHEHRRDLRSLRAQYFTWGLGFAVVARKHARSDPAMRRRLNRVLRSWFRATLKRLLLSVVGRSSQRPAHSFAELRGGIVGCLGEYQRSQARIAIRKREHGG